jgi:hypothetical protein
VVRLSASPYRAVAARNAAIADCKDECGSDVKMIILLQSRKQILSQDPMFGEMPTGRKVRSLVVPTKCSVAPTGSGIVTCCTVVV